MALFNDQGNSSQTNDFGSVVDAENAQQPNDFAAVPTSEQDASTPGAKTPIKTAVMSIASSPDTQEDTYKSLLDENLQKAQALVNSGQEFSQRLAIAGAQQQRQMKQLNSIRVPDSPIKTETQKSLDDAYNALAQEDLVTKAKTAAEMETVRRVQDDLTSGNAVEAKLTYNLLTNGNAEQVFAKEAAKNLILAQAAERYSNEAKDQGWGSYLYNLVTGLIPTEYNFSRSGVVPGSKTSIKNFFLSGSNLQSQSELLYSKYKDPADLAEALEPGGELDASIRSNASTLGGYSPQTAHELLGALTYQSDSDRLAANLWGLADAGTVALPEVGVVPWKAFRGVPGLLTRIGARDAARDTVADAWKTIVEDGADAAAAKSGLSEADVVQHMETTGMNPSASTEHEVPLAVDVQTRMDAANNVLKTFPQDVQATRATNPTEIMNAYKNALEEEEAKIGHTIKDYKFMYEDVRTGAKTEFNPTELPEQGNVVHYIEYTAGRKPGGGFATAKAAKAEATKRGLWNPEIYQDAVTNEIKVIDPEFDIVGYHGTASAFDKFDPAFGGKLTDAKSAKMGFFFTDNPDVAYTYAIQAAKDNAASLSEVVKLGENSKQSAVKLTAYYKKIGLSANPSPFELSKVSEEQKSIIENLKNELDKNNSAFTSVKNETSISGQNVRPVKLRMKNPYVHDYAEALSNGYDELGYSRIIERAKRNGHDGVILKNTDDSAAPPMDELFDPENAQRLNDFRNHDVYVVFDQSNIKSPWDAVKIQRDVSGQFFFKNRVNVKEQGFYTTPLNTPNNNFLGVLRSDARRMDRSAQVKAVAGGQNAEKLQVALSHAMKASLKGISKEDKGWLDQIIRKGQNESRWLSDREFKILFERVADKEAPQKVLNAYKSYQAFNDVEYTLRNDEMYKQLVTQGYETVGFDLGFGEARFDGTATVDGAASIVPPERVFNATDGIHYTADNQLTKEELDRLVGNGYQLIKTKDSQYLPDGTTVRNFLVHRGDIERRALERQQLGYVEGGHRLYTGKYFAKQAKGGIQPDTGQEFLKNPNVFRTSNNPNKLRDWAEIMNRAIADAKAGILDPQHFDDNVFSKGPGDVSFPTGREFVQAVDNRLIDLNHPIEVVGDREMPSAYATTSSSVSRFVDPEETSATGYYRTTGRLYTSKRGDHLLDESGNFAETVDPWKTMNQAMFNISRMSSLSAYKANVIERFEKTYGKFLKMDNPSQANAYDLLNAKVGENVPAELGRRIRAEQAGAKRIMRFETSWDKGVRQAHNDLANWVLGSARGGPRQAAHDFIYHLKNNNPVQFLRGLAFDAKLGFFNIGQVLLQSSTMAASIAIHPEGGLRAMMTTLPLISHTMAHGAENVLDVLAKRSWKMAGFASEGDMKEFMRFVNRTGFMQVGSTHLMINQFGPHATFGASGIIDGIREAGRSFFYLGEQFNRAVASRLAYEQLKKEGLTVGSAAFRERFMGLADDLTLNMTHESSAAFQHGLWSVPTQFWAYNVRMMDAMFGDAFTTAQKLRLIVSQFALFGAGGVPVAAALSEYWKERSGSPVDINSVLGTVDRGAIDKAVNAVTGADVRFGERVGTGSFLSDTIKDIFGQSEYGEKSAFDVLGGATFSINWQIGKQIGQTLKYALAESGGDQGYNLTRDSLLKLAMNVSTVGNTTRAMIANKYGYYVSNKGSVQVSDLPSADAFWIALGLRPQELDNLAVMNAYLTNKQDVQKDAASLLRNWRQEAFNNPDLYDENAIKANTFVRLLPTDVRDDVLKQVNSTTDQSFYDHIAQKWQTEKAKEQMTNGQ